MPPPAPPGVARGVVRVYAGPGAGARALAFALEGLRAELAPATAVTEVLPEELRRGGWEDSTVLLVFPGGADLPLCAALEGEGAARVAAYVAAGGAYLGLCCGAYYASAECDFERGSPGGLEVLGPRPLRFFPGAAVGAVAPGFAYASEAGAAAAQVRFAGAPGAPGAAHAGAPELDDACVAYVNGAPAFHLPDGGGDARVAVLARYAEGALGGGAPAAVRCAVGAGVAVLCGPHPEMAPRWLDDAAADADAAAAVRVRVLQASLQAGDAGRVRFWRALLAAAGAPLQPRAPALAPAHAAALVDASSLEAPPSPLRSIGPGPTAPAVDATAAPPPPLLLLPPSPVAVRRVSAGAASGLGPLRACSHADLLALPRVPPLEQLVPVDEPPPAAAPDARLYAPLPRLLAWLAATAALGSGARATRAAAPRLSRAAGVCAGATALAAGASVRLGRPRGGVPITAQTLSACLCGLALGPHDGARAAALYAAVAAAGVPVLTPHAGRPTTRGAHTASAGYVAGFALCAAAVGAAADACARRRASRAELGASVAAAAAAAQLATAALGGAWAAGLLMSEGAMAVPQSAPRPWLLELALASAASVPPFLPGLLLKAMLTGAAAAAAAPLIAPPPPLEPALRRLLDE